MGPPQLLVLLQPLAIIQGKAVSIQLMPIGYVLGNAVHHFAHSALSHSRGTQCSDKQGVIVTLKAIQAVSFKLWTFFFPHYVCGGISYLTLLPLDSGGEEKNMFVIMLQRKDFFKHSFSKTCKPFQIHSARVRNLAFSLGLCLAETT